MKKQPLIYILILLVGIVGGTALGYFMSKSKIDTANAEAEELNIQFSDLRLKSEAESKAVNEKLSRYEAELKKARNDLMSKNTELLRTQTELSRAKAVLEQALQQQSGSASTAPATSTASARTTTSTAPTGPTREYTIKNGDSLWKIAANELGNGARWEEIDKLNPNIDQNTILEVGSKIKIPAK